MGNLESMPGTTDDVFSAASVETMSEYLPNSAKLAMRRVCSRFYEATQAWDVQSLCQLNMLPDEISYRASKTSEIGRIEQREHIQFLLNIKESVDVEMLRLDAIDFSHELLGVFENVKFTVSSLYICNVGHDLVPNFLIEKFLNIIEKWKVSHIYIESYVHKHVQSAIIRRYPQKIRSLYVFNWQPKTKDVRSMVNLVHVSALVKEYNGGIEKCFISLIYDWMYMRREWMGEWRIALSTENTNALLALNDIRKVNMRGEVSEYILSRGESCLVIKLYRNKVPVVHITEQSEYNGPILRFKELYHSWEDHKRFFTVCKMYPQNDAEQRFEYRVKSCTLNGNQKSIVHCRSKNGHKQLMSYGEKMNPVLPLLTLNEPHTDWMTMFPKYHVIRLKLKSVTPNAHINIEKMKTLINAWNVNEIEIHPECNAELAEQVLLYFTDQVSKVDHDFIKWSPDYFGSHLEKVRISRLTIVEELPELTYNRAIREWIHGIRRIHTWDVGHVHSIDMVVVTLDLSEQNYDKISDVVYHFKNMKNTHVLILTATICERPCKIRTLMSLTEKALGPAKNKRVEENRKTSDMVEALRDIDPVEFDGEVETQPSTGASTPAYCPLDNTSATSYKIRLEVDPPMKCLRMTPEKSDTVRPIAKAHYRFRCKGMEDVHLVLDEDPLTSQTTSNSVKRDVKVAAPLTSNFEKAFIEKQLNYKAANDVVNEGSSSNVIANPEEKPNDEVEQLGLKLSRSQIFDPNHFNEDDARHSESPELVNVVDILDCGSNTVPSLRALASEVRDTMNNMGVVEIDSSDSEIDDGFEIIDKNEANQ